MYVLQAEKSRLTVIGREYAATGAVNAYEARFLFSEDWDGMVKTAVFKTGETSVSVLLGDGQDSCTVPWEVLQLPGRVLYIGVYGTRGGETVLPTVWANCGQVLDGVKPSEDARDPSPGLYEQVLSALAGKVDGAALCGTELRLTAEGETVASVLLPPGGGGGASASDTVPRMDGAAAVGSEASFARGDHVHPSDTSRLGTAGDGSRVTVSFSASAGREALESGEALSVLLGKAARYFADLGGLAFRDSVALDGMDAGVKASLAKADTALQSFTEADPTVPQWAKAPHKPAYTAGEVGAIPLSDKGEFALKSDIVKLESMTTAEIDLIMDS